jgi:hypothetical protein
MRHATDELAVPASLQDFLHFTTPENEPVQYSVSCHPALVRNCISNWSLDQIGNSYFDQRLLDVIPEQVRTVYEPSAALMSGIILEPMWFTRAVQLSERVVLRRPAYDKGNPIECEGTALEVGEAFATGAGGCAIIGVSSTRHDKPMLLMAHAGRDSLIDRSVVEGNGPSRPYFSEIDQLVVYAKVHYELEPEELILRSFFALPWRAYPHDPEYPVHGPFFQRLVDMLRNEHGGMYRDAVMNDGDIPYISLSTLIECQALWRGIRVERPICTLPMDGPYAYTRHTDPHLAGRMRNLVLGVRL